ncbi:MAG TPA: sigma-70 family RNA polymerase sigma factor [Pirellulaceae bacterium]|nr:sigma-70 family RNA polymerase sigma factor [Pirellulaceae bacterium]
MTSYGMKSGPAVATPSRGACRPSDLSGLKDDQLLSRFFQEREDAAFGVLVERYGSLVYGVCRRILFDPNDAEDAFQATFLVLVRKGGTLRDPGRLASWLYGVAYRTARKLRAKAALRTKSERQASEMPTKSDVSDMTYEELQSILDEEINQLPEKYALPLVLCYLEGKTNAQAAAQLGWPEGSISRRLSRARELLRSRLAKRGLAMSVALIAAVFARPAAAAVPGGLLAATTRAATLAAQGVDLSELVSPRTAKVVHDVVAGMSAASKFAIPTIVALVSLLLVITTLVWQFGSPAHAASLLHFRRADNVHGLTTTPLLPAMGQVSVGDGAGSSCSVAAQPPAAAASGAAAP